MADRQASLRAEVMSGAANLASHCEERFFEAAASKCPCGRCGREFLRLEIRNEGTVKNMAVQLASASVPTAARMCWACGSNRRKVPGQVDIGVICVSGIEADGTLSNYDYREVRVTQAIMKQSRQVWLVADHTKFGRHALVRLGSIEQVNIFFMALPVLAEAAEAFAKAGEEVIVAGPNRQRNLQEAKYRRPTALVEIDPLSAGRGQHRRTSPSRRPSICRGF